MARYLAHKARGLSLREIGAAFTVGPFAASQAILRVERQRLTAARVRQLLRRLLAARRGVISDSETLVFQHLAMVQPSAWRR